MQGLEHKDDELKVYMVVIDVVSGQDLPAKDIDGKSDPFCQISVLDVKDKTKVIKNELNPQFNEKFTYKFFKNPKKVTFEVYDKDLTSNEFMGYAEFDLDKQLSAKEPFNGSLPLKNKKNKKTKGMLNVRIATQEFSPVTLHKMSTQQQETIYKQTKQIDRLSQKNESLQHSVEQVQQQQQQQQKQQQQARGDTTDMMMDTDVFKPTKRRSAARLECLVVSVMAKMLSVWQMVLAKCVYGFPVIGAYIDFFVLFVGSLLRLELGYTVLEGAAVSKRPKKLLKLYEFEGSIECKTVRETLCALDLDCIIYPCPSAAGSSDAYLSRYADEAQKWCGKKGGALPVLVDENYADAPLVLYKNDRILQYLKDEYGNNVKMTFLQRLRYGVANQRVSMLVYKYLYTTLLRSLPAQGNQRYGNTVKPSKLLELYSYEPSPFCVRVRETLSSLEIPYVLKNVAVGSKQKRQEFKVKFAKKYPKWRQKMGLIQVPLLIDPNTEKEVFESEDIKKYLLKTYCVA
eukprot:CAMPEP_0202685632 /NCGR_PEP_ID=MMETSP1385-20130828/1447_1 /ASSEMBLY_ACC=CAM_ASM_000861 /TAXON_ID=933848 /ORGANISM="Elphidium margaritaceum" /LENGTH=513 /DNA_ID=CAMNT_0049340043 /DNA_START=132 /DNA_END=1673 /DNA_ORIENTATION=+